MMPWRLSTVASVVKSKRRTLACFCSSLKANPPKTHQRIKGSRRFYKHVGVSEMTEGKWQVLLDNKVLRTPSRNTLHLPNKDLALMLASEWDYQTTKGGIQPSLMPIMTLVSSAIDQIEPDISHTISSLLPYLETDTTCFPCQDESHTKLQKRQQEMWRPLHLKFNELGIHLGMSDGGISLPCHSPDASLQADYLLRAFSSLELAAVQAITMECKSLALGIGLAKRWVSVEEAFEAARSEETHNIESWGLVEGGHDLDISSTRLRLYAASTVLWLMSTPLK